MAVTELGDSVVVSALTTSPIVGFARKFVAHAWAHTAHGDATHPCPDGSCHDQSDFAVVSEVPNLATAGISPALEWHNASQGKQGPAVLVFKTGWTAYAKYVVDVEYICADACYVELHSQFVNGVGMAFGDIA